MTREFYTLEKDGWLFTRILFFHFAIGILYYDVSSYFQTMYSNAEPTRCVVKNHIYIKYLIRERCCPAQRRYYHKTSPAQLE